MFDCLDAIDWLKGLWNESVDLCVTDPAYESLEKHRSVGTTTRLKGAWFPIFPNASYPQLFRELYRVMKPNTHLYVFSDQESMFTMKPAAEAAGFRWWKFLVWDKVQIGMGYHYRARHELILFLEKGKRRLRDLGMSDVLTHARVRGGYPTEKPTELMQQLIYQSSRQGVLVIDPFFGSGAVAFAALRLERRFRGTDVSELAHKTVKERWQLECQETKAQA